MIGSGLARLGSYCRRLLHRRRAEEELDQEVRAYFEMRAETYASAGMPEEEARRAARVKESGPEQVKESVREARTGAALEATLRDIRYAVKALRRTPGFTAVAVLTLALGIGANTAIFSLIDAVMLRSLPVDHPEQLALLTEPAESGIDVDSSEQGVQRILSYPVFEQLRAQSNVFSGLAAAESQVDERDVYPGGSGGSRSLKVHTQFVSGEFFRVLGVRPILGRLNAFEKEKPWGANPVAVLSYDGWQNRFGGQADIVGSTVRVGHGVFTVLGVTPPGFRGILVGADADLWLPLTMQRQALPGRDYLTPRDTLWLQVLGRLAPGISMQSAQAGVNVAFQQALAGWAAALPTEKARRALFSEKIELRPGGRGASELRGEFSDPLALLMAMVGVVLLIACANIANLMLARANGRRREIGVRLALGAARARLIRQLLTESLVVAAAGGVLGVLVAAAGTRLLLAQVAAGNPTLGLEVSLDSRVLLFTAAAALATGVLFGLAPAIGATRPDVSRTLAANARGSIGGKGRSLAGRTLAVTQVALSLVLLIGAALFVRTLHNLVTQDLGYSRDHLWMARVDPAGAGYQRGTVGALYDHLRTAFAAIPGVRAVSVSNYGLFDGGDSMDRIAIDDSPVDDPGQLQSLWSEVGPGHFKTLGIPLLLGRDISEADSARGAAVCLINESFARKFFPSSSPLGKHVKDEYPTTIETFEIIGVVADAREHAPGERKAPRFYANLSHPIGSVESVTFVLRGTGSEANLGSSIRETLRQVDPGLSVLRLVTVNEQLDELLVTRRLVAQLAAYFSGAALFMAAIGLYGVMAYSVSSRTSEIGLRMALGASGTGMIRMVLGETLGMVALGIGIGLPCALAAGRLISSRLYGLTATDPAAMATAGLILLVTAALAVYVPARRASRIDPMVALRHE